MRGRDDRTEHYYFRHIELLIEVNMHEEYRLLVAIKRKICQRDDMNVEYTCNIAILRQQCRHRAEILPSTPLVPFTRQWQAFDYAFSMVPA